MKIDLTGKVDAWEVYQKLEAEYLNPVEQIIRTRLPLFTLEGEAWRGAEAAVDALLREKAKHLSAIQLGARVVWDEQVDRAALYSGSHLCIVDTVDGAAELRRGGTEVTSTLGVFRNDGTCPLAIVSYPFARDRVIDINGLVYRLPSNQEIRSVEDYRLPLRKAKRDITEFDIAERYDPYDETKDKLRSLEKMLVGRRMVVPIGSIAKMALSVTTGPFDIFMSKKRKPEQPHDYRIVQQIIGDAGGVFTDLQGNKPDGHSDIDGIIASSHPENYRRFIDCLRK